MGVYENISAEIERLKSLGVTATTFISMCYAVDYYDVAQVVLFCADLGCTIKNKNEIHFPVEAEE